MHRQSPIGFLAFSNIDTKPDASFATHRISADVIQKPPGAWPVIVRADRNLLLTLEIPMAVTGRKDAEQLRAHDEPSLNRPRQMVGVSRTPCPEQTLRDRVLAAGATVDLNRLQVNQSHARR